MLSFKIVYEKPRLFMNLLSHYIFQREISFHNVIEDTQATPNRYIEVLTYISETLKVEEIKSQKELRLSENMRKVAFLVYQFLKDNKHVIKPVLATLYGRPHGSQMGSCLSLIMGLQYFILLTDPDQLASMIWDMIHFQLVEFVNQATQSEVLGDLPDPLTASLRVEHVSLDRGNELEQQEQEDQETSLQLQRRSQGSTFLPREETMTSIKDNSNTLGPRRKPQDPGRELPRLASTSRSRVLLQLGPHGQDTEAAPRQHHKRDALSNSTRVCLKDKMDLVPEKQVILEGGIIMEVFINEPDKPQALQAETHLKCCQVTSMAATRGASVLLFKTVAYVQEAVF